VSYGRLLSDSDGMEMPRHPEARVTPNEQFKERWKRIASPVDEDQRATAEELAGLANEAMDRLYPDRDLSGVRVNKRLVLRIARGETRWPQSEEQREALLLVCNARVPEDIGLSPRRYSGRVVVDGETVTPSRRRRAAVEPVERNGFDTTVAHPARRYNYWLGGKDHFAADRESGDEIERAFPTVRLAALENRDFLRRAVRYATGAGVRQFLDVGTGLPAPDNTHEVAQRAAPDARVVYVDNDPLVMTHARALLRGTPQGRTTFLEADLRDTDAILGARELQEVLDLRKPVCLLLGAVLHFVFDDAEALRIVGRLRGALPPGSLLVISHFTLDFNPQAAPLYQNMLETGRVDVKPRTCDQVTAFFEGTRLVEPGIVPPCEWQSYEERPERPRPEQLAAYAAVGVVV
jgi:hypothetical protein